MATTYAGAPTGTGALDRSRPPRPAPTRFVELAGGWLGPLLVTALAAYLRFDRLRIPSGHIFDEVYYAKDAQSLLRHGVELNAQNKGPGFVVHPTLGKWAIALGEAVFGNNELGWRVAAAVCGSLAVLLLTRIARRMTGSTLLGCFAGLLLALDGLAFVQSRVAMLDVFLMFWVLAAFGCLVVDRDRYRDRVRDQVRDHLRRRTDVRWWRLAAGGCLGAAAATKWSAVYYLAAFLVLAIGWDVGARRGAGTERPARSALAAEWRTLLVAFVVLPAAVYTLSWTGWFLGDVHTAYDHDVFVRAGQDPFGHVLAVIGGWAKYQWEALQFHVHLDSPHPYKSQPWTWLLLARPVSYFYTSPTMGQLGCSAAHCSREVLAIGTPAIWWTSIPALLAVGWLWVSRRDWRAAAVLVGVGAGLVPWFAAGKRTMFLFYALPALPFLILALTLCAGLLLGPAAAATWRRCGGAVAVGTFTLLVTLNFFYLYPVLAAKVIPYADWYDRMWFHTCTSAGKNVESAPCWI